MPPDFSKFSSTGSCNISYVPSTSTAKWEYTPLSTDDALPSDIMILILSDNVTDASIASRPLDGDWVNPTVADPTAAPIAGASNFTMGSGNGTAGGQFGFVFTILAGDFDQTNDVDFLDISTVSTFFPASGPQQFATGDATGDGDVDFLDISIVSGTFTLNNFGVFQILADFDGDYDVDADDLQVILDSLPLGLTNATYADGDLNGDGMVTQEDFDLALAQFGTTGLFIDVV